MAVSDSFRLIVEGALDADNAVAGGGGVGGGGGGINGDALPKWTTGMVLLATSGASPSAE